ncbi:hypothetical protein [Riemerella anatipestifer]|uniref:hypothetical protein n=1 Tax=Riemerella anatipestifer TaxID=34085 RepID=UPI000699C180|nr:hypothetical protein [Riemerella anatipestifer]
MIVDNLHEDNLFTGKHSLPQNTYLTRIIQSVKNTFIGFINSIQTAKYKNLNEDELTQIFVKQNTLQLQNLGLSFMYVGVQYRDIYHKTKGIPDIYYAFIEQNVDYEPTFVMEAKRLPAPTKAREKEYVIGTTKSGNPNGGIERFKLKKHGLGLSECGILAYIEDEDFNYWFNQINDWIKELSNIENSNWNINECLNNIGVNHNSSYCLSEVDRDSENLKLHHLWVKIKPNPN